MNFKNIYQLIFSTFKLFIKSKWKFSAPRSKKILVIDGADDPFKFFLKEKNTKLFIDVERKSIFMFCTNV